MSLTPEQLEARKLGMGGGDAPVAAGVSPYKRPLELHYEKTGELEPDQTETEAMQWGSILEEPVAQYYAETTGRKIRRQPHKVHREHPWMRGNVDRQIIGDKRGPAILEVKTTNTFSAKDWEHGPTDSALLQLQHYLAIYGYQWGSIAVLIAGQQFKYFDVERDDELIDYLIQIEAKFWQGVQERRPPDADWDQHTVGLLKKLYPLSTQKTIALPLEAIDYINQYRAAKGYIEEEEARKARMEGWLKDQLRDADRGTIEGFDVTWRSTKAGTTFDEKSFKEDCPDMYAKYLKPKPGHRVFRVTPTKEKLCLTKSQSETTSLNAPDLPQPDPPSV